MGHCIAGIVLKGNFDGEEARKHDLFPLPLGFDLTLFHVDHYYSACRQALEKSEGYLPTTGHRGPILANEIAMAILMERITGSGDPLFALIATDYFGGVGDQLAQVYRGRELANDSIFMISPALKFLGVTAAAGLDEFDTVGLGDIRSQPDWLEKYEDLADELGV